MSKKLIIFDLDGTLLDTIEDLAAACNAALVSVGLPTHPVADYPNYVGNGIINLMLRALSAHGLSEQEASELVRRMETPFKAYYGEHGQEHTHPYAGIMDLLTCLQERGYLLAVASNKYQQATETLVTQLLPGIRFVSVLGQREGVPRKPDPTIVRDIMSAAEVSDLQQVLYIGDSDVDMQTARNAGLEKVGVTWGFQSRAALETQGADHLVDKPSEILRYV